MFLFACCPFSSRRPLNPPASSWMSHGPDSANSHAPVVGASHQEETPRRVASVTKSAFQSPRQKKSSLSSSDRPFSVTPIPSPQDRDCVEPIGPDSESTDVLTPLRGPTRLSLRHYYPLELPFLLGSAACAEAPVEEPSFTNVVPPNTPDPSPSRFISRTPEHSCEISKKSSSEVTSSDARSGSTEGVSATEIMNLIFSEHGPGSTVPEYARQTRLVFKDDEKEIYQVLLPDEIEDTIFFDLNARTSTPSLHGASQGFDD